MNTDDLTRDAKRLARGLNRASATTLDVGFTQLYGRRQGNSTRQIDYAIQLLFSGAVVIVLDHHELGTNFNANKYLLKGIRRRLATEHQDIKYTIRQKFIIYLENWG